MPMYCLKCQRLYETGAKCEKCLFSRLREVKPNDPVRLITTDYMRAEMLEALLHDAEIPYTRMGGASGALGMNVGMRLEAITFVVPFAALDEARALCMILDNRFDEESQNTQDRQE